MPGAYAILFVFCLATSCLLSGMEAGLLALSRFRIRHWMRQGNPKAKVLHSFLQNPETFLWTILVGNTLSNIVLVSLGVSFLYSWLIQWPAAFLGALALAGILFYAFCELLPKTLFRLFPNRLCLAMATPFRLIHLSLKPLVSIVATVSHWLGTRRFTANIFGNRHELRLIMEESNPSITKEERVMINRVLDLPNLPVQQISIPIDKAVCAQTDSSVGELIRLCRQHGFNRLPVWHAGEKPRRLAGLVNLKEILYQSEIHPENLVGDYVNPALYLDSQMSLDEALGKLQKHRQRLAVVWSPNQIETGIISLQDILKAVFGEIRL